MQVRNQKSTDEVVAERKAIINLYMSQAAEPFAFYWADGRWETLQPKGILTFHCKMYMGKS